MRRTLLALLLALAAAPAAWAATGDDDGDDAPPPLKASLAACVSGPSEDQRFAVFTGSMPAYRGTKRMAMRFDLWTRTSRGAKWERVKAKGFGRWQRSDPNRAGFVYTKRVERLSQAAEYRASVRFRWYQSGGAKRSDRTRRTPVCRQPDQRPNLRIESLTVMPGADAGSRRYVATIVNDGRTAADAFDVTLYAGDGPAERRSIAALPAGERATVELAGPACPEGLRVVARADAGRVVDESAERDNGAFTACDGR